MKAAGIVAEFNPLHNGHKYLLDTARDLLGDDGAILCCMSGCAVQRGEPAIFEKHARAEAAVRCGADLVIELPLPWSLSSAERFANGAVGLLSATGVVDKLVFGSECGSIEALSLVSEALLDKETDELIKKELSAGVSYAAARQRALEKKLGERAQAALSPNNILAIEYIKSIMQNGYGMLPITVARRGSGHDSMEAGCLPAASALRRRICGKESIAGLTPECALDVFNREIRELRGPVTMEKLENAFLARLRMLPKSAYDLLPDASEGLGGRLYECVHTQPTVEKILNAAKTKRYALSRIRRMLLSAALGVRAEDGREAAPYIKVLALNERGRGLIKEMNHAAELPILTKPASVRRLGGRERRVFVLEADAEDFFALAYGGEQEKRPGADWRTGPRLIF